jgi:hypothetical protein
MNHPNERPEGATNSDAPGRSAAEAADDWRAPTPTHAPWERWLTRAAEGFAAVGAEAVHAAVLKTLRPRRLYAAFAREGAKVESPADVAAVDPAVVERVARRVRAKYVAAAAAGGVGTGALGLAGWVAEVPFVAALSLRAASELALAYGADPSAPAEARRLRAVLAALPLAPGGEGPSTGELASLGVSAVQTYVREGALAGLSLPLARRALQSLAGRWGARRVARALPWVGGAVGGAMAAWYVGRVLDAVAAHYRAPRAAGANGAAT